MFLEAAIKCPPLGRHYLQREMHRSELALHIELLIIKQFTLTVIRTKVPQKPIAYSFFIKFTEKNGQFNSNPFVSTLKIKEQANGEGKSWKLIIGKLSKPSVYKVPRYKKAYTCIGFFILKSAEKAYNTCSEQVDGETSRKCSKVSHRDISHCRV